MRIAFVGKGGSGKTTLTALFARHLARANAPVLAIDGDINQHLVTVLAAQGNETVRVPSLGERLSELKEYLRGDNPRITSVEAMVKTTPAGRGSRLLRLFGADPIHARHVQDVGGVGLMVTGGFAGDDLGVSCYHSKLGGVELYLNHLVDGPGEYAVVDMTAGADSFASGLFSRFDMTFVVVEPTRKAVSVLRQYREYAAEFDVPIGVVGNKVAGEDDVLFLKQHVGEDLVACFGHSLWVRAREQGRTGGEAEPEVRHGLDLLRAEVDRQIKDWTKFQRQAIHFHLRNADAWANRATGEDLAAQVDPEFVPGPEVFRC